MTVNTDDPLDFLNVIFRLSPELSALSTARLAFSYTIPFHCVLSHQLKAALCEQSALIVLQGNQYRES